MCSRVFFPAVFLFFAAIAPVVAGEYNYVPGRILVKTKPNLSDADFEKRLQPHGAPQHKKLRHLDIHVVEAPESQIESVLASLRRDSGIEFAERDGVAQAAFVPNDTYISSGAEWHLGKISAPQAWDFTVGGTNTIIAILDSGINANHPELVGRILPGYNFVSGTNDTSDDFGHGTAVAGTAIAAGNNGIGIAGVAFGCSVLAVKVVNSSGFAAYSAVADGIKYAVDHGARVINLSIAGSSASSTLQAAVDYAWSNNVVVVAAAGNNATSDPQYPAACNHVIGVSATEPDDSLAPFSSYGGYVSLAAPGDNIWTLQRDLSNPYGSWRGTSFSSPIVAAVAALVASVNPSLSGDQITSVLEQSADDTGIAGFDPLFGNGRVNAWSAILAAAAIPGAQITTNSPPSPQATPPPPENSPTPTNASLTIRAFKGNYAGLLANTNGVTPADSGYFRVKLNAFGDTSVMIRRSQAAPLSFALHLDTTGGTDQISGHITDGAWVSEVSGDRNVFNSRLNPAQQAGVRSFVLEQSGDNSSTAGTAARRIAQSGSTHIHGRLADLRSFSASSTLGKNGDYPFYLSFNRGSEVVIGWLNFPANQQPSSSGTVLWVKSGTNSFAKSLRVDSL